MMEQSANRAAQQLAQKIRDATKKRTAAGMVVPFFDTDPEEGDPTNLWAFMDGRLMIRLPNGVIRELATTSHGDTTSSVPLPVEADLALYSETYAAIWGQTYCASHGIEAAAAAGYGITAAHGQRRLMVGFDATAIAADIAGSVVRSVELSMINLNADAEQVTVTFGTHNTATPPAAYAATRRDVWGAEWPRTGPGVTWRQPDAAQLIRVLEWIRDDGAKGLTVDQAPAGELDWASVRLRVGFTK